MSTFLQKLQFLQICYFFVDSKSRAQELSNDVSFDIFGHQTWDLEGGGGQIDPPPSSSWFSRTPAGIGLKLCKPDFSSSERKLHINTLKFKISRDPTPFTTALIKHISDHINDKTIFL